MLASSIPGKFSIPFANGAGGAYIRSIPIASQIGIVDGAASFTTGFPPLNFAPIGSGGIPPNGADFNGILFDISGWSRWQQAGGPVFFDGAFSTAIGGYPLRSVLASSVTVGLFWVSLTDNNNTNPDSDPTDWLPLVPLPASLAELQAGANAVKYVTPATLADLRADAAAIRLGADASAYISPAAFYDARSSAAEVRDGTDDHGYVTPAGLAALANSAAGVIYHPGGLIEQYATVLTAQGSGNYTTPFNTPFLTSVDMVTITQIRDGASASGGDPCSTHWRRGSTTLSALAYKHLIDGADATGIAWHAFGQ